MRKRTNKLLSLLLTLTMVLGMLPAMSLTAFAAEPGITLAGSDSSGEGWSYTASSQTLTLNNYDGGYIQGSGLSTLNLVLEGTNTITVDDANAKGIALGNNQNLNISGSGSLTINATGGSNLIYGIECNKFTMTSGTVTINANSSNMVYGVNANDSLSVTGGKLTVNITGTSDGRGLYCKTGKLTVGSGAEVDVTVTNNGSNIMYGIYNEAYTESVTDNGDIELAGTVTVTRDSGSTGSGYVYGIANGGSNSNTDGVISITGGSVTVTNAYYGIIAFTKGHAAAFADVTISGGTVNVTSTTSDSLGIVSWNNGVTISGGTVTASTANKALWLADQDSTNKTGLVKITGDAKVSLTSAASKALIVQGDESNTSTRVHQINLSSGGSVTVKSTSSDETYRTHPVQGYFSLGSSTKITEGSFRSTPDGTNAGGGKLFQADSTTNQVVVAYSTPAPDTNSVSVNGHNFASPTKLYYKNGDSDTTNDSTDYNAHYDPTTGILELKNYSSGRIIIGGSVESDITIKLVGDNVISSDSQYGIVNSNGGDITITADSDATLTINVTDNSDYAHGIACDIAGSYASRSREITISGKAKVTVNATSTSSAVNDNAVGIFTGGKAAIVDDASFTAICKSSTPSGGLQSAAGIYGYSGVTINTTGKVDIDVSQCSGAYNYGIFGNSDKSYNRLEKVSDMTIKWKNGSSGAPVTPATSFDSAAATHAINVDTTNCVATYRYGTPYTVTVNNGSCDAANRQYLEGDTVTVTADTISDLTFKKWSSADVTVANETNATTTFIMPGKDVTVTANYYLFTIAPSFTRTSDTQGTISFTLAANPSGTPRLVEKDSDTLVGSQYFSGSTLDRSNTVKNGTGTDYDVPAGEYRIAVEYSGVWFYSDVFAVNYTGTPQATVDNTIVSGTTNQMLLNPVDVFIKLQSDTFQGVSTNDNVESWFTNLPAGLTAVIRNVGSDAKAVTVRINGTPTEVKNEAMAITIPGEKLASGAALTVTENADAKFNISAPTSAGIVPPIENKTVTVGTDVFVPWPEGAISYQRFEDSTQVGSGDKSGYPDGMYIPAESSPTTKTFKFKVSFPGGWVESNEFTVTWTAATSPAATVGNVTISGTTGIAIVDTEVTVTLNNDTFASALSGNWITNLPAGLTQSVSRTDDTRAKITVSGTSTAVSTAAMTIVIPNTQLVTSTTDLTVTANADAKFNILTPTYSVTINAGANMTLASGNANQSGLSGAMTDTVYTAADGYYFPTDYAVAAVNGITVTRNSYTQITVSGTPTANTTITLAPATAKTLSSIAVTTAPAKVTYTAGEYFDTSGMVVTATYSDSSTKAVTSYTFTPTGALTTDDTSITISYTEGGVTKTATQTITVNAATKTLSSIAVTTAPTQTTYTAGDNFDPAGMVVTATYSDSSTAAVTGYIVTDGTALTAGKTSVAISYTENGVTKTATQTITVNAAPKTLSSIAVTTAPAKVTYTAGEYFDTSGMVVTATYSDGSTKAVTSYTFTPTAALTTDDTSITISYTEGGVTETATQTITVNAAPKTLSSIAVTTAPAKVTYTAGEYFDTSGMVVTATYSDSSTKAVTSYTFASTGELTTGDTSITISYTEGGVTKTTTQAITVNASSAPATYTVTVNGSYAANSGAGSYDKDETVYIYAGNRSGYTFDGWTSSDVTITNADSKTASFVMPDNDVTVTAHWTRNAVPVTPTEPSTYTIKVEKTDNGDVTVSPKSASKGTTVTITVEPDKGYTLETLTVTDRSGDEIRVKEKNGKYTFTMPASKVYVEATFMEDHSMLNFFVDVPASAYYYDAVMWAAKNGITGGTDATHFSPNATCTRAQAVTFLWRAAGSPAPKSSTMPFTDVPAGSYYETAVLWAVENGITKGTGATTFSPNATCSRGQIVSFLWRALGSRAASGSAVFTDVKTGSYYETAVLWAVENGITNGTGNNAFSPNADCTRAQIVSFLYRTLVK